MIKINFKNAKNGIIKTITDSNYNATGEDIDNIPYKEIIVYEYDDKINQDDITIKLLYELIEDLGINIGSKYGHMLSIKTDWGSHYEPNLEEIDLKIKELKDSLKDLSELKKLKKI